MAFQKKFQVLLKGMVLLMALGQYGCAGQPVGGGALSKTTSVAQNSMIRYATLDLEKTLSENGLKPQITEYWQAHQERDWKKKFLLEQTTGAMTEDFYILYHGKSWALITVEVLSIKTENETVSVSQKLEFLNPETSKPYSIYQIDQWSKVRGDWKHIVNDPMLTGMAPSKQ